MGFKFMLKPLFPVGSASSSAPQTALKNKNAEFTESLIEKQEAGAHFDWFYIIL